MYLRPNAPEDQVNLTNVDSLLVKHVAIRDVHDLVAFCTNWRYAEVHHQSRLFGKGNYIFRINSPEFVYI